MMASCRSVIYYLPLLVIFFGCWKTEALIKEWHPPDTDWQNPNNWDGGRLPCWRSTVILPEEVVISVFLNGSVAWSELVMPQTGELVLDNLILDVDTQQACNHEEVQLKNWKPGSWFNPDDWLIAEADGAVIQQPLAIPHSERIPCAHDSVHLSNRHSLSVDFSQIHSLTVGQVKYGDQLLTAEEWRSRLSGPDWRYQVHNPPRSVFVNGTDCQDVLGCRCGHDVDVMQMVCSNAGTLCSNQLECSDSFRPPGHCCDMCGAMMKVTVDERTFTKSSLDRLVSSMLVEDKWPGSQSYSYRTGENVLHLMIVDNTTNERSIRLAARLHDYLSKDQASSNLYGILALEMVLSGLSHAATHHLTPEELHLIASNLTTVFATLIIFAVVGAGIYFYRKHRWSDSRDEHSVGFARFQNDSGNVEIAIDASFEQALARPPLEQATSNQESPFTQAADIPDTSPSVDTSPDTCHERTMTVKAPAAWKKLTRAFTNPLFGDPSAAAGRMSGRWTMSSLMKTTATQENPIYSMNIPDSSSTVAVAPATADVVAVVVVSPGAIATAEITSHSNRPTKEPQPVILFEENQKVVDVSAGLAQGTAEGEGVAEANVAVLVDTFPAVADDDTVVVAAETPAEEIFETVMEDVSLVDDDRLPPLAKAPLAQPLRAQTARAKEVEERKSPTSTLTTTASNGGKHPLKKLWKKATKKLTPSDPPAASSSQSSDAEQTAEASRLTAVQQSQQREDEMQLTLAEETDE